MRRRRRRFTRTRTNRSYKRGYSGTSRRRRTFSRGRKKSSRYNTISRGGIRL